VGQTAGAIHEQIEGVALRELNLRPRQQIP